jgi:SWI/SNF-related matrix-associated actin-dependent regulator of chromatin subfamily A member 5
MIQHGADKIINSTESMLVQDDIDDIITRGEARTQELNSKYASLNFDDLQIFKSDTTTNWEGEDYGGKRKAGVLWIEPSKRERKSNYNVDYREVTGLMAGTRAPVSNNKLPRAPRQMAAYVTLVLMFSFSHRSNFYLTFVMIRNDFQFFPPRLLEIYDKETAHYRVRVRKLIID